MRAAIDIGSNSLLLLITDDNGKTIVDRATVVGLGRGLGERGVFRPDRMEAALTVLKSYAAEAFSRGVAPEAVRAVATSASRRALNATTFYTQVKNQTGLKVDVIDGDTEARLSWKGGISGLELPPGPVLLADPGGGSTEVIVGEGSHILARTSLEIGTVRLTEQFLGYGPADAAALARLRAHVEGVVSTLQLPVLPRTAVAVAGTATTIAAAELGLTTYDGDKVHGSALSLTVLRRWIDRLIGVSPERRRELLAVSPDRADTVLAGAVIMVHILEKARRQTWRISDHGLRHGLIAQ